METSSPGGKTKKGANNFKKIVVAEVEGADGVNQKWPIHFGIKTYFQNIVPSKEKEKIETVDYLEESDFHYMVGSSRRSCGWDRACMWCGLPLLIAGIIAVLVGQFVPLREPIIARRGSLAYLDKKALVFNSRLELCRILGLIALCTAAFMILLSFLIWAYIGGHNEYSPVGGIISVGTTSGGAGGGVGVGIPLSGVLTQVQPVSTQSPPRR